MKYPIDSENNKQLLEKFQDAPFEIWENWDDGDGTPNSSGKNKKVEDKIGLKAAMNSLASNNNCRDAHVRKHMHYNCYGPGGLFFIDGQGEIIIPPQLREITS